MKVISSGGGSEEFGGGGGGGGGGDGGGGCGSGDAEQSNFLLTANVDMSGPHIHNPHAFSLMQVHVLGQLSLERVDSLLEVLSLGACQSY